MRDTIDIEKVYDVHSQRLYNISLRIVGCSNDAEEIMHDSLLKYWHFQRKSEIKDLGKWLTSICIRRSIDRLREKNRRNWFLESYEDPALQEDAFSDEDQFEVDDIVKALHELPDIYRAVVSMHLFEGYDYREISQITGAKEGTIRTIYTRGRQKLAAILKHKRNERH